MENITRNFMKQLLHTSTFAFALALVLTACGPDKDERAPEAAAVPEKPAVPTLDYSVVATLPHDTTSFTEGLLVHNDQIFESTGSPEGSSFRSVFGPLDPATGKINVKAELDKNLYFGEGIVFFKDKVYQVTYRNQVGFMYDAKTFKRIGQFSYAKEGWGMTTDGTHIIMSNGTEELTYYDADFKAVKTLSVKDNGYAQDSINELEYINGYIYANVWMTGYIIKIDPATGNIVARINLTGLSYDMKNMHPYTLEMNGIAYDAAKDKIYVTGKAWPKMYEIKFAH